MHLDSVCPDPVITKAFVHFSCPEWLSLVVENKWPLAMKVQNHVNRITRAAEDI